MSKNSIATGPGRGAKRVAEPAERLRAHRHAPLLGRLLRFAVVGVVVTGSYMLVTYAGIRYLSLTAVISGWYGCAAAIAVSYLGQKYFTFRSDGAHRIELPKFLLTCVIALAVSSVCMWAVDHAGLDYRLGVLIGAALLPLCNFGVMYLWVFRHVQPKPE